MAKEEKTNLYLLSIVAIVAIVGIVVLILNSGAGSVSLSSDDLSGQAIATLSSGDAESGTSSNSEVTTLKPIPNSAKCFTCNKRGKCGPPVIDC